MPDKTTGLVDAGFLKKAGAKVLGVNEHSRRPNSHAVVGSPHGSVAAATGSS